MHYLPWQIGRMTPGELYDAIEGHRQTQTAEREAREADGIAQAWLTAKLMRLKRLPDLDRLLKRKGRGVDARTPEERRADFEVLKGKLGR